MFFNVFLFCLLITYQKTDISSASVVLLVLLKRTLKLLRVCACVKLDTTREKHVISSEQ